MLLLLAEIQEKHGIPPGTMRSAISRGVVSADKKGSIVRVDDEDPRFIAFKASYRPRAPRASSLAGEEIPS